MTDGLPDNDVADLAAGYRAYVGALSTVPFRLWSDGTLPDRTAYDAVSSAMTSGPPEVALALLVEVLRQGSDEDIPSVAHGLVQGFVKYRAPVTIEGIEWEARTNERLRRCLGRVRVMAGELPPEILARLVRASGGIMEIHPAGSWMYLRAAT